MAFKAGSGLKDIYINKTKEQIIDILMHNSN